MTVPLLIIAITRALPFALAFAVFTATSALALSAFTAASLLVFHFFAVRFLLVTHVRTPLVIALWLSNKLRSTRIDV